MNMRNPHRQRGTTMIEVLVAGMVTLIGLLGMMGLQMRAYSAESESYQRTQALILIEDISNRIRTNRGDAAAYVAEDIGIEAPGDCTAKTSMAKRDVCEWANLLRGSAETSQGNNVGAMLGARACIRNPEPNVYLVLVVWQGTVPTAEPASTCGQGQYGLDLRRVQSTIVRIADLAI